MSDSSDKRAGTRRRGKRGWVLKLATIAILLALVAYVGAYSRMRHRVNTGRGTSYVFPAGGDVAALFFAPATWVEGAVWNLLHDDAELVLDRALERARLEDKRVLLVIGTTKCLPCRQLEEYLDETSPILAKYFVIEKMNLDVLRNGEAVHLRYREHPKNLPFRQDGGPAGMHIPWIVVLDERGEPLLSGDGPGDTIALPQGSPANLAYFLRVIRETAPNMTEEELGEIERAAKDLHERI